MTSQPVSQAHRYPLTDVGGDSASLAGNSHHEVGLTSGHRTSPVPRAFATHQAQQEGCTTVPGEDTMQFPPCLFDAKTLWYSLREPGQCAWGWVWGQRRHVG